MHQQALDWIARYATDDVVTALDVGGRETNGHARWLWPNATWTVVDAADGRGVDVVADGATWRPDEVVDLVLNAEVAEHTPVWREIVANCAAMLKPGGEFVFTAAGPGREVHGLYHDDPLAPGHYENIDPAELRRALTAAGFAWFVVDVAGEDVRAYAKAP